MPIVTWKRLLIAAIFVPLVLIAALALVLMLRAPGPFPDYALNAAKAGPAAAEPLKVGVAVRDITPDLSKYDKFVDKNGDGLFKPADGDYFEDTNGNGKVDAVWIAGFGNNRPAQGVHDPLWARAMAFENNGVRVVLVSIDSVGMFHHNIIDVRNRLNPALKVDQLMVSCTHDHEAPDTMGIWSVGLEKPYLRFDYAYLEQVKRAILEAAEEAVGKLQPAEAVLADVTVGPEGFVDDSRDPQVFDNVLHAARFVKPGTDETIATMMEWGCHPETLAGRNPYLTSDFVHNWREGVEKGVAEPKGAPGLGGVCVYYQGMVGGLMNQLHTTVPHRNGVDQYREESFDKAQALGDNLALVTLAALRGEGAFKMTDTRVAFAAKTFLVKPQAKFGIASFLRLVHPGFFYGKVRTEVNAYRIGDIEILTVPGEMYPEIGNGGVVAPDGRDFPVAAQEVPPLREGMQAKMKMIFGLANDELGYIIPKSQWDVEPPFAFKGRAQYGEENSFGPESGPSVHKAGMEVLGMLHAALGAS